MDVAELVARYWAIGARTRNLGSGQLVSCPVAPEHPLATYLMRVSAVSSPQVDRLLDDARHSVNVLLRVQATCIAGRDDALQRRVGRALSDGGP